MSLVRASISARQATALAVLVLTWSIAAAQQPGQQEPDVQTNPQCPEASDSALSTRRMALMAEKARGIQVSLVAGEKREAIEARKDPVFRLLDVTRDVPDGGMWAWGNKGRPAAILTLAIAQSTSVPRWMCEFASLSADPVEADLGGPLKWSSETSGWIAQSFPEPPEPAGTERQRLRQMRALARRFTAEEYLPPPMRFQLRLLPQPILRYADPEAGQLDGAIFLLCHGTNPEVLLIIEAQQLESGAEWKYALIRNTIAEISVQFDGTQVWHQPHIAFSDTQPTHPYWATIMPMDPSELTALSEP